MAEALCAGVREREFGGAPVGPTRLLSHASLDFARYSRHMDDCDWLAPAPRRNAGAPAASRKSSHDDEEDDLGISAAVLRKLTIPDKGKPTTDCPSDPFSWKELELSSRRLDAAHIRISQIDLSCIDDCGDDELPDDPLQEPSVLYNFAVETCETKLNLLDSHMLQGQCLHSPASTRATKGLGMEASSRGPRHHPQQESAAVDKRHHCPQIKAAVSPSRQDSPQGKPLLGDRRHRRLAPRLSLDARGSPVKTYSPSGMPHLQSKPQLKPLKASFEAYPSLSSPWSPESASSPSSGSPSFASSAEGPPPAVCAPRPLLKPQSSLRDLQRNLSLQCSAAKEALGRSALGLRTVSAPQEHDGKVKEADPFASELLSWHGVGGRLQETVCDVGVGGRASGSSRRRSLGARPKDLGLSVPDPLPCHGTQPAEQCTLKSERRRSLGHRPTLTSTSKSTASSGVASRNLSPAFARLRRMSLGSRPSEVATSETSSPKSRMSAVMEGTSMGSRLRVESGFSTPENKGKHVPLLRALRAKCAVLLSQA